MGVEDEEEGGREGCDIITTSSKLVNGTGHPEYKKKDIFLTQA